MAGNSEEAARGDGRHVSAEAWLRPQPIAAAGTGHGHEPYGMPPAGTAGGAMQIHVALGEPLWWRDNRLDGVPLVHVTPGLNGVRKAVGEASRSVLPARPTIAAGQPAILDPSRAPDGGAVL